jgi:hypothetical protein
MVQPRSSHLGLHPIVIGAQQVGDLLLGVNSGDYTIQALATAKPVWQALGQGTSGHAVGLGTGCPLPSTIYTSC